MIKLDKSRISMNCGPRKHGLSADMVVVHYTAMRSAAAAIERLCDQDAEVSAHYVISEQGCIYQLVDEANRAWHAGAGQWGDVVDVNSHSIGIELANATNDDDAIPFPEPQMNALEILLADILKRNPRIDPSRIIGHSDMASGRKNDPGRKFDWRRLALQGLSVWPTVKAGQVDDWASFKAAATRVGYRNPMGDDAGWDAVLDAFRQRFAPHHSGLLISMDLALIVSLADEYPCKSVDLGVPIA